MSQVGKALRTLLVADSTVNTNTSGAIREGRAAQGDSLPYVVFNLVGSADNRTKDGANDTDIETWLVYTYAASYDAAYTISDAVRLAIEAVGEQTVSGVDVDGARFENESAAEYNDENDTVQIVQQYEIRVKK